MVRKIARDTGWNVGGALIPVAAGLWAFPRLLDRVELDAFGWLSIAWIVLGAGGLFDLGLGRALTREVSGNSPALRDRIRAGLELSLISGALFTLVGILSASSVVRWVGVGRLGHEEVVLAVCVLSFSLVPIVVSSALRGILEGAQLFMLSNAIRGPAIALCFVLPLAVKPDLPLLVAAATSGRWMGAVAYAWLVSRWWRRRFRSRVSRDSSDFTPIARRRRLEHWGPLLTYGGSITVTSAFAFFLSQADRLLIARILGPAALGAWSPVFEMISRITLFPLAFASALFPRMVKWHEDPSRGLNRLMLASLLLSGGLLVPFASVYLLLPQAVELWLGPDKLLGVLRGAQWLVIGVFFNSVAQVPFTFLQASGRPEIPAILNGLELPAYILLLLALLESFGVAGAGMAWAIRAAVDAVLMFAAAVSVSVRKRSSSPSWAK